MYLFNEDSFLINEHFHFYLIKGFNDFSSHLAPNLTLLEGELVYHSHSKAPLFLVSDIFILNGDHFDKF